MNLLCLGDSLTYGYDVSPSESWTARVAAACALHLDNEGVCGDITANMFYRLRLLNLARYDAYFYMGGTNDILLNIALTSTEKNMQTMGAIFQATGKPVYLGIPPLTQPESTWYGWQEKDEVVQHNDMLTAYREWLLGYARKMNFVIFDFYQALQKAGQKSDENLYADGVHPTAKGYAVLARVAGKKLQAGNIKTRI